MLKTSAQWIKVHWQYGLGLIVIGLVAAGLRTTGLNTPTEWCYDEGTHANFVANIYRNGDPGLTPAVNPTGPALQAGALTGLAVKLKLIPPTQRPLILVGRSLSLIYSLFLVFLVAALGAQLLCSAHRKLLTLIGALLYAFHLPDLGWSQLFSANVIVSFWSAAALLCLMRGLETQVLLYFLCGGLCTGWAVGTNFSALVLLPLLGITALLDGANQFKRRQFNLFSYFLRYMMVGACALAAFAMFCPWYFVYPDRLTITWTALYTASDRVQASIACKLGNIFLIALPQSISLPIYLLGIAGGVFIAKRALTAWNSNLSQMLLCTLIALDLMLYWKGALFLTPGRILPIGALWLMLFLVAVEALMGSWPRWQWLGWTGLSLLLLFTGTRAVLVSKYFVVDSIRNDCAKFMDHTFSPETTLGLLNRPYWYSYTGLAEDYWRFEQHAPSRFRYVLFKFNQSALSTETNLTTPRLAVAESQEFGKERLYYPEHFAFAEKFKEHYLPMQTFKNPELSWMGISVNQEVYFDRILPCTVRELAVYRHRGKPFQKMLELTNTHTLPAWVKTISGSAEIEAGTESPRLRLISNASGVSGLSVSSEEIVTPGNYEYEFSYRCLGAVKAVLYVANETKYVFPASGAKSVTLGAERYNVIDQVELSANVWEDRLGRFKIPVTIVDDCSLVLVVNGIGALEINRLRIGASPMTNQGNE